MDINIEQIKALAEILKNSELSLIEISEGENSVRLENKQPAEVNTVQKVSHEDKNGLAQNTCAGETQSVNYSNLKEIKSPMIGVFYSSPSPEAAPYVKAGDIVKKDDVLCIIESMKLMNDILSDVDGEIVDICVENEQVVEYGQTLFKIKPLI